MDDDEDWVMQVLCLALSIIREVIGAAIDPDLQINPHSHTMVADVETFLVDRYMRDL